MLQLKCVNVEKGIAIKVDVCSVNFMWIEVGEKNQT